MDEEIPTPQQAAESYENYDAIAILRTVGLNLNGQNDPWARTPTHFAAIHNNVDVVKILLLVGANTDLEDSYGTRALAYALIVGSLEVADILIGAGNDINSQDNEGFTALMTIANEPEPESARLTEELISRGAGVNVKSFRGITALHVAVGTGNFEVAKRLIDAGAEVNAKDTDDDTTLHFATHCNDPKSLECADLLLRSGFLDINIKNNEGETPLHRAVSENNIEMVKFLLSRGATVDSKNDSDVTPLGYALVKGKLGIADVLIEAGGDVNNQNILGDTVLHTIGDPRHREGITNAVQLAEELLSRGVNVNIKAAEDLTALHIALGHGEIELAKFLIHAGADVNCQDDDGDTALHYVVTFQPDGAFLVQELLSYGADVNVKNKAGLTPLEVAAIMKKRVIQKQLTEAANRLRINVDEENDSSGQSSTHDQ